MTLNELEERFVRRMQWGQKLKSHKQKAWDCLLLDASLTHLGLFASCPPRQTARQVAILALGARNRMPGSSAGARQACQLGDKANMPLMPLPVAHEILN
jgi:hypothetical protein